jgi:hypothetical protein
LQSRPIAKKQIEVHSSAGNFLFHTTNYDAFMRVDAKEALRISDKVIQLVPAKTTYGKVTWAIRQSGYAGPLVLQVQT